MTGPVGLLVPYRLPLPRHWRVIGSMQSRMRLYALAPKSEGSPRSSARRTPAPRRQVLGHVLEHEIDEENGLAPASPGDPDFGVYYTGSRKNLLVNLLHPPNLGTKRPPEPPGLRKAQHCPGSAPCVAALVASAAGSRDLCPWMCSIGPLSVPKSLADRRTAIATGFARA